MDQRLPIQMLPVTTRFMTGQNAPRIPHELQLPVIQSQAQPRKMNAPPGDQGEADMLMGPGPSRCDRKSRNQNRGDYHHGHGLADTKAQGQ